MGWASAGYTIFNPMMRELQKADVPPDTRKRVAVLLIRKLGDHDWDTMDESLEEFKDDPAVVAAFREAEPSMFEPYDEEEPFPPCAYYPWEYTV